MRYLAFILFLALPAAAEDDFWLQEYQLHELEKQSDLLEQIAKSQQQTAHISIPTSQPITPPATFNQPATCDYTPLNSVIMKQNDRILELETAIRRLQAMLNLQKSKK